MRPGMVGAGGMLNNNIPLNIPLRKGMNSGCFSTEGDVGDVGVTPRAGVHARVCARASRARGFGAATSPTSPTSPKSLSAADFGRGMLALNIPPNIPRGLLHPDRHPEVA